MSNLYPVSGGRVSDLLLRNRLTSQLESERQELLRLQDQISTGIRLSRPSDDAPAAVRAASIQRILEQKEQVKTNLEVSHSYVTATDSSLATVSSQIAELRAQALTVVDTTTTEQQRDVFVRELQQSIRSLVETGNYRFRGRYMFAGSTTGAPPFDIDDNGNVIYHGNQHTVSSFLDIGFSASTNVPGTDVFGAISEVVHGTDLNPVLSSSTRLADLNNGRGVHRGSFVVSDGTTSRTIDISNAATVGDVVRLIETNPPQGRTVIVRIGSEGLIVDLDDAGGGTLSIRDLPAGTTAAELGIRRAEGVGTSPLIGDDIDPRLRSTTELRDLLGTRASAVVESSQANADIRIEAVQNGDSLNNVAVRFVEVAAAGDQAFVQFDAGANELIIDVNEGSTTAATVVDAINATGIFSAELDDKRLAPNDGTGFVDADSTATTSGGSGINLDQTSGLQISNGDETHTISIASAETVEDLLNLLNQSTARVLAKINERGTGIDVHSRLSGTDFHIGENGGSTATELGLRTFTEQTRLKDLNFGRGVGTVDGVDLVIRRTDGVTLEVDLSEAATVGDVITAINSHPDNLGEPVVARLAAFGNGIELDESASAGLGPLTVSRTAGFAAWDLGLVPRGSESAEAGADKRIVGADVNPQETKSVFNTLIRLTEAVNDFDLREIERAATMLDDDFRRLNFARAELGARANEFSAIQRRVEDEEIELRSALSKEIDTDFVQAVSDLTARQTGMEATMQLIGRVLQLSVLDFL